MDLKPGKDSRRIWCTGCLGHDGREDTGSGETQHRDQQQGPKARQMPGAGGELPRDRAHPMLQIPEVAVFT